jgi:hypothetical protein
MSALALAPSVFERADGHQTLDELIIGVCEALAAHDAAGCPVCGGELETGVPLRRGWLGRCKDCGTAIEELLPLDGMLDGQAEQSRR